jgi:putative tRNA adenosine deaminase-associated protein
MADEGGVDFVLAACHQEGRWDVRPLPNRLAENLDELVATLRVRPGDHGAVALVSVDEDFFVAIRVFGTDVRYLLSDVTAATEWPLARAVVERLGLPLPGEEERMQPAGDLSIFADFGVDSRTVAAICDEIDSYPEDILGDLADQMGFGSDYEAAVDAVYG